MTGDRFIQPDSELTSPPPRREGQKDTAHGPLFVDGHVDLPYYMMNHSRDCALSALEDGPFTLEKAKQSGFRVFCTALYCEDRFNGEASFKHLTDNLEFTREHFDGVLIVKKREDLEDLKKDPDALGTLLLLENADGLVGNLSRMNGFIDAGIRIVGLTHMGRNRIGDGNRVPHSEGFTSEGIDVIRSLDHFSMVIDVAHLHPKCFWKLLDVYNGPIISSHTGIRNVCDTQRNIDLDQAGEIARREGVVGITFNPDMLSLEEEVNHEHVFVHMDTLVQKFGPGVVGIGSDFCGFDRSAEGLEDITQVTPLIEIMLGHGYGDDAMEMIMGRNWLRLFDGLF